MGKSGNDILSETKKKWKLNYETKKVLQIMIHLF